ncbi:MATH and LRR domain-containing protein PFE0570w [Eurytemora carolleeae]|uniref:MATH and LRR domain-containing protein PFE0570w n=1 Tax=Eurytemora carolleeae TaxID=1294199 RepID=UPI000C771989|nr:MATH and LRR domain-containing protein PFE0570w [Eurytemora carolleeae]|eukprot:XP_023335537.1 MATH and LRR domain-containing protein PFE0570w-like [Eurytemora affinis]
MPGSKELNNQLVSRFCEFFSELRESIARGCEYESFSESDPKHLVQLANGSKYQLEIDKKYVDKLEKLLVIPESKYTTGSEGGEDYYDAFDFGDQLTIYDKFKVGSKLVHQTEDGLKKEREIFAALSKNPEPAKNIVKSDHPLQRTTTEDDYKKEESNRIADPETIEVGHVGSIYDKFKVDSKLIHETANHLVDPGEVDNKDDKEEDDDDSEDDDENINDNEEEYDSYKDVGALDYKDNEPSIKKKFGQEEKQTDIYSKYNVDSKLNHEIKDASDKSENEKEKEVTKKLKTVGDISDIAGDYKDNEPSIKKQLEQEVRSKVDIYSKYNVDSKLKHETQDAAHKKEKQEEPTENLNTNKFGHDDMASLDLDAYMATQSKSLERIKKVVGNSETESILKSIVRVVKEENDKQYAADPSKLQSAAKEQQTKNEIKKWFSKFLKYSVENIEVAEKKITEEMKKSTPGTKDEKEKEKQIKIKKIVDDKLAKFLYVLKL